MRALHIHAFTGVRFVALHRRGDRVGYGVVPPRAAERPLPQKVDPNVLRIPQCHSGERAKQGGSYHIDCTCGCVLSYVRTHVLLVRTAFKFFLCVLGLILRVR